MKQKRKLNFRRQGLGDRKKVGTSWRRPVGWSSKQLAKIKGRRTAMPKIGYGTSKETRGENLIIVNNVNELANLKKGDIITLSGKVGNKNRVIILEAALKKGLIVRNYKKTDEVIKKIKEAFNKLKEDRKKKLLSRKQKKEEERKKREAKKKEEEEKKKTVKIKKTEEASEEKEKQEKKVVIKKKAAVKSAPKKAAAKKKGAKK